MSEHYIDILLKDSELVIRQLGDDRTNPVLPVKYECWRPTHKIGNARAILCVMKFQHGPVKEYGYNGITEEVLIRILLSRLESHQAGNFPSDDNAEARGHLHRAMECLQRHIA